ncbi:hypothetical protein [Henriciella sp.]|uniref:hypothetical protein n=1 Tax=Henriciella sp. TaxID=1968823 RepID=UPI003C708098
MADGRGAVLDNALADAVQRLDAPLLEQMVAKTLKDHGWEEFLREKLLTGESLKRYYPLHADALRQDARPLDVLRTPNFAMSGATRL